MAVEESGGRAVVLRADPTVEDECRRLVREAAEWGEGRLTAWPEGVRRWREAVAAGRLGRPEDVGDACVFLASPLASWITGHDAVVDGGVSARPTW